MVRETPANLSCKPREGPPLALQLSSNRREREVGQVPAGVERILALAPGEPWFRRSCSLRGKLQRQNGRWDLRKEGGDTSTASCPKGRIQPAGLCHQPGIPGTVQWALPTEPFPNDTKPWAQGQGPHTLREDNHRVSRPERPYGPLSSAELLAQIPEWAAGGPGGPDNCP